VARRGGKIGPTYIRMVNTVRGVLANMGKEFPEFAGRQYKIAGFGWHQGWNDGCDSAMIAEYEANMADFIRDVRQEFDPAMPLVIANSGFYGAKLGGERLGVLQAQDAMADEAKYTKFKGNVAVVDTRPMWRDEKISPSGFDYHWNHNGITHYLIGEGMGKAMVKLLGLK
jgi:alpha-galactosidase